ncbi:YifB family Mg chelatase-like AAA ATPase [Candidatus Saccharibacteria bacterium]|jgi:magnesium chelatase family protein|nr:YifB family Mg chelatase-like AAA ATPase [Candidatus Saccharibacteria bacterium]
MSDRSIVHSISESGGATATTITIECHMSNSLPSIVIVGFANRAVDEAKERIRGAFAQSKLPFPKKRITINLAPADIPKDSSSFDLGIATAILQTSELIPRQDLSDTIMIGELGLTGEVRGVRGIIGKLIAAKKNGFTTFYLPEANFKQAQLVPNITIIPVKSLSSLYNHFTRNISIPQFDSGQGQVSIDETIEAAIDMVDISGQNRAKRLMEIAAAGGHNAMLSGPPGTGKSMLAKALAGILPPMSLSEILEVTHLHSLASDNFEQIISIRPYRSPHHSASNTSIIGGGQNAKPGEVSLAHRGVLLLDEFPEYQRSVLESLRQPLEDKEITISRAKHSALYPADFMLIATSNPCPCGYYGSSKPCSCAPQAIIKYQRKISGPIMDRIDMFVEVDDIEHSKLLRANPGNVTSKSVRQRVAAARKLQSIRYSSTSKTNSQLSNREIKKWAALEPEAEDILNKAASKLQISARSYMRLIKVSRTIADLEGCETIKISHMTEAIQYRRPVSSI